MGQRGPRELNQGVPGGEVCRPSSFVTQSLGSPFWVLSPCLYLGETSWFPQPPSVSEAQL